jgi:hypothetical protein
MLVKRLVTAVVLTLVALVLATSAFGGATTYAGPRQFVPGEAFGSSFSNRWLGNHFSTYGSGYDKVVTFIDNGSYSWHNTVRNTKSVTETYSPWPLTVKGHCKSYSWFSGSCWLH